MVQPARNNRCIAYGRVEPCPKDWPYWHNTIDREIAYLENEAQARQMKIASMITVVENGFDPERESIQRLYEQVALHDAANVLVYTLDTLCKCQSLTPSAKINHIIAKLTSLGVDRIVLNDRLFLPLPLGKEGIMIHGE